MYIFIIKYTFPTKVSTKQYVWNYANRLGLRGHTSAGDPGGALCLSGGRMGSALPEVGGAIQEAPNW